MIPKAKRDARKAKRRARQLGMEENISPTQVKLIYKIFNDQCFKCSSDNQLAIDHYRPLSKGGSLSYGNAILLCKVCNSTKNDKDPEQFFTDEERNKLTKLFLKHVDEYLRTM